ncbi:MAG: hypothetical protein U1E76_01805 [Planctomycetota bacterium]
MYAPAPRWRLPLAILGIVLATGAASAGVVVPRDLLGQLKMIGETGRAAHVTILSRETVSTFADFEFALQRVKVRVVDGFFNAKRGDEFEFLVPAGTTISPRDQLTQPGRNVVVFVARDARVTKQYGDHAFYLFSFAEIYDVQRGLGREATVVGQGKGAAIEDNIKIGALGEAMGNAVRLFEKRGG